MDHIRRQDLRAASCQSKARASVESTRLRRGGARPGRPEHLRSSIANKDHHCIFGLALPDRWACENDPGDKGFTQIYHRDLIFLFRIWEKFSFFRIEHVL